MPHPIGRAARLRNGISQPVRPIKVQIKYQIEPLMDVGPTLNREVPPTDRCCSHGCDPDNFVRGSTY